VKKDKTIWHITIPDCDLLFHPSHQGKNYAANATGAFANAMLMIDAPIS